jgi:hypothetical protein
LRISYDIQYFSRQPNETLRKILFTIVLNHFNEHDHHHRKVCFSTSTDCRFHNPRTIQEHHELKIDFKAKPSIWFTSYRYGENMLCCFLMEPKRSLPDAFLNNNNSAVSEFLATITMWQWGSGISFIIFLSIILKERRRNNVLS